MEWTRTKIYPWIQCTIPKNIHQGDKSGHKIESEIGQSIYLIDLGLFLMSEVTAGHEIESEVGMFKNGSPASLFWSLDPP